MSLAPLMVPSAAKRAHAVASEPAKRMLDRSDDDGGYEHMKRKRGRKRRTCHSCEQSRLRCDHCVCGVGGRRACANPSNHPPGQCRKVKRDANGMLVWGERTTRLMGTSRVTAMCESCQKITKPEEEESVAGLPVAAAPIVVSEPISNPAKVAAMRKAARPFRGEPSTAPAPAWTAARRDAPTAPAPAYVRRDVGSAPLGDARRGDNGMAAQYGAFPPPAPAPSGGVRLGIPMARSTWSPILRLVNGKPVTMVQYQQYLRARAYQVQAQGAVAAQLTRLQQAVIASARAASGTPVPPSSMPASSSAVGAPADAAAVDESPAQREDVDVVGYVSPIDEYGEDEEEDDDDDDDDDDGEEYSDDSQSPGAAPYTGPATLATVVIQQPPQESPVPEPSTYPASGDGDGDDDDDDDPAAAART